MVAVYEVQASGIAPITIGQTRETTAHVTLFCAGSRI
jgi:hypothetical protein